MKSEVMTLTGEGQGMKEAFAMTEALGVVNGLTPKNVLHLRLLSEELFGMLRGIAGKVEADFWLEIEEKRYELHMKSTVKLTEGMRDQFLAASSSGKNEAAKGFMGKLRVMIANVLLSAQEVMPYAMMNTVAAHPMGGIAGETASVWSMAFYRQELMKNTGKNKEADDAWDELEKSIVANIADDVKVSIVGKTVEITVCKAF